MTTERLDGYVARRAGITRSEAKEAIKRGRISVCGEPTKVAADENMR